MISKTSINDIVRVNLQIVYNVLKMVEIKIPKVMLMRLTLMRVMLVIFCGSHNSVTSKAIIKKANVWNQNASDIPETLIKRHTVTLSFHP